MSQQFRWSVYAIAALIVWGYIIARAIMVPISHDEAVTFLLYVQSGKFLPWNMVWDANNHLLNSALMWPCWKLFGMELFWLRLPNVLSFGMYAYIGFKLLAGIKRPLVWAIAAAAWLSPALLVEFFAQMRGYGLSIALLSAAIWQCSLWISHPSPTRMWWMWAWLWAALLANMSMMNTYLIMLFISAAFLVLRPSGKPYGWMAWGLGGLLPFVALGAYALAMRSGGLLYYGERDGFVEVTVRTLMRYTLYADAPLLAWTASLFAALAGTWLLAKYLKGSLPAMHNTGALAAALMLLNVAGAVALCYLLEVNYPEDRTGIYFLPLFILSIAYFAESIATHKQHLKWAALPLLVFPAGLISRANLGYTHLWKDIQQHQGHFEAMQRDAAQRSAEATIEGYFLMGSSWGYHNLKAKKVMQPLIPTVYGNGRADYLMCYSHNCSSFTHSHDTLFSDPRNDMHLLRRKETILLERINPSPPLPEPMHASHMYYNLWVSDQHTPLGSIEAIDLQFTLRTGNPMPLTELVIAARSEEEESVYYDAIGLSWIRPHYSGDTLHIRRLLNLPEKATQVTCYLWNMTEKTIEIEVLDIGLLRKVPQRSEPDIVLSPIN